MAWILTNPQPLTTKAIKMNYEDEKAYNDGFIPDESPEVEVDECNCSDPQCGCDGSKRLTREFI